MPWKPALIEALAVVWHKLEPFMPGILGAAVAQAFRPGLGIRQRFVQWTVSVVVFHFVSLALATAFAWPKSIADVVGFFVAFCAFEGLHAFQQAAIETGASAIRDTGTVWRHLMQGWAAKLGAARTASTTTPTTEEEKG